MIASNRARNSFLYDMQWGYTDCYTEDRLDMNYFYELIWKT